MVERLLTTCFCSLQFFNIINVVELAKRRLVRKLEHKILQILTSYTNNYLGIVEAVTNKVLVTITSLWMLKRSKLGHGWKVAVTSLLRLKLKIIQNTLTFFINNVSTSPLALEESGRKASCQEKVSQSIPSAP